jgi:hypothetical protein
VPPRCSAPGRDAHGRDRRPASTTSREPAALGDRWFDSTGFSETSALPGLVGPEWDQVIDPAKAELQLRVVD